MGSKLPPNMPIRRDFAGLITTRTLGLYHGEMSLPLLPVFAASASARDAACTPDGSNLCKWAFNLTHNTDFAKYVGEFDPLIKIVFILTVGWVVQRLVRRFIKRLVKSLQ